MSSCVPHQTLLRCTSNAGTRTCNGYILVGVEDRAVGVGAHALCMRNGVREVERDVKSSGKKGGNY